MKTETVWLTAAGSLVGIMTVAAVGLAHAQAVVQGQIGSQLDVGSRGADVRELQTLLASDRNLYQSGLITGYYGPLTEAAVVQFQLAYGLPPVGRVGPLTLAKLNSILAETKPAIDIYAPIMRGVAASAGANVATITWSTNESARGKAYFDTAPLISRETSAPMTDPQTSGMNVSEASFGTSHSITLTNLAPDTTYYYLVESTDASGNVSVTVPFTFVTVR